MKRLLAVLAVLSLLGVMVAAPASAHGRLIKGDIYMKFLGPAEECSFGGGQRTWVGTVEIDGETYGWADFLISLRTYRDGEYVIGKEYWAIFETEADHIEGPTDTADLELLMTESCDPELVLVDGYSIGGGKPPNGTAVGRVDTVARPGPLDHVRDRALMVWRGMITEFNGPEGSPSDFEATLFIR